jgi:hypothetical protein
MIRQQRGRYLRDQLQALCRAIEGKNSQLVENVLRECVEKKYVGAVLFRELLAFHESREKHPDTPTGKIILLDAKNNKKANIRPDKSDLNIYEKAFESI